MAAAKPNAQNARAGNSRNNCQFSRCQPRVPRVRLRRSGVAEVAATRAAPAPARCLTWIDSSENPSVTDPLNQTSQMTFGTRFGVTPVSFANHRYAVPSQQSDSNEAYGSSSQSTCRCIADGAHLGCRCQVHALYAACPGPKHQRSRGGIARIDPPGQGRRDTPCPAR
jgi:hypothetical protein